MNSQLLYKLTPHPENESCEPLPKRHNYKTEQAYPRLKKQVQV